MHDARSHSGTVATEDQMKQWIDAWADDARRRGLAARYVTQQVARIEYLAGWLEQHGDGVCTSALRAWLADLKDRGVVRKNGNSRPCSPKTLNNHLCAARKFFGWCVENGLIRDNPTDGIGWAKRVKKKGRSFSVQQVWRIFEAAQQDEIDPRPRCKTRMGDAVLRSPYYRVMMATGMRAGAAEALRVRHFQLDAEIPYIAVPAEHDKTRQERAIPISFEDRAYFGVLLKGRHPDEIAFKRPHANVLKSDAKAAGMVLVDHMGRGVGFHCFRRWHARQLKRARVDTDTIKDRLGHSSILTTQDYLDSELVDQQLVAEELSRTSLEKSGMLLDGGSRIHDNSTATDDLTRTSDRPDFRAQIPQPSSVARKTLGDRPASGQKQPGSQPGRLSESESLSDADPEGKWAQQDSKMLKPQALTASDRAYLLSRVLDLLESETPGRKAEGHGDDAGR